MAKVHILFITSYLMQSLSHKCEQHEKHHILAVTDQLSSVYLTSYYLQPPVWHGCKRLLVQINRSKYFPLMNTTVFHTWSLSVISSINRGGKQQEKSETAELWYRGRRLKENTSSAKVWQLSQTGLAFLLCERSVFCTGRGLLVYLTENVDVSNHISSTSSSAWWRELLEFWRVTPATLKSDYSVGTFSSCKTAVGLNIKKIFCCPFSCPFLDIY